jgi:hypothetical protein
MSTTITTTIPKPKRNNKPHAATRRRPQPYSSNAGTPTAAKKRRRKRRNNNQSSSSTGQLSMYKAYIKTLADPWQVPPVRIGFGTMVPTNLMTAYYRATTTAFTDGSIGVFMLPSIANMVNINNSGLAAASWVSSNAQNITAIQNGSYSARVVSGGIRLIPQVAATAAPGVSYAGSISQATPNGMVAGTLNTYINSPLLKMGFAASGASAVILPVDPTSFEFISAVITGYGSTTNTNTSCPIIIFTGLPASSNVLVEVFLNIETVQNQNDAASNVTNVGQDTTGEPTLADYFPSLDNLWSSAKRNLPEPMSVATGFARAAHVINGGIRLHNTIRSARNNYYNAPSGAPRVTIEEVS